ncbi:MAG TPA: SAM-dependent chlorinase/fluorinase [Steroidobacteraceae bacterium]|nr:SAM-dependent chlorinase/fluorinase [Steroidobacteraceae bacterium]
MTTMRSHLAPTRLSVVALLLAGLLAAAPPVALANPVPKPVIVFMTDFGIVDDAVAICKGVIKTLAPDAEIIDLTHQVTPYSIAEGARLLGRTAQYYPAGTIFLSVIDPGVGTSRRSIIVKTRRGQFFVLPDNGLITRVVERDGIDGIREITNPKWRFAESSSSTFHGRDIYSPAAAHLQRGDDWTEAGPELKTLTRLDIPRVTTDSSGIQGEVVALDGPYGNLVTNIDGSDLAKLGYHVGDAVRVGLSGSEYSLPFVTTFGNVPVGDPLLFIDSRGLVSLAINQGNFASKHGIAPPVPLRILRK